MTISKSIEVAGTSWLITGGCGFIGRALVYQLRRSGAFVRVFDNFSVGSVSDLDSSLEREVFTSDALISRLSGPVQVVEGDVRSRSALRSAFEGVDYVVHLAGNTGVPQSIDDPDADFSANVMGTFNCLSVARERNVKRFIFASSGAPLGSVEPPIHEEVAPHPISPYGASKLAAEGYCSAFYGAYGLETVALRFGNVYGPRSGHKSSVVAKFIRQAMSGGTLEIYGDGSQTRDFIYVSDLNDAIIKAALAPAVGGETFQIATSRETTIAELVDTLQTILRKRGINEFQVLHCDRRPGDVLRNYSDTSKALKRLGWCSETNLQSGLEQTVEYFLNEYV